MKEINPTMIQYFEWYIPSEYNLWNHISEVAPELHQKGISHIWLAPAYKGAGGTNDTGYGVYDLYDLGEFHQKGSVRTKYGTKEDYLKAIRRLQDNNIKVLADIVLNHRMGADELEEILAYEVNNQNRLEDISPIETIKAWTKFYFQGRENTYSDFKLNWTHFNGIDWNEKESKNAIYRFYGKNWCKDVDKELGNFDYLMGADVDFNNVDVVDELKAWGKWYLETTKVDGFRLDAIKHIRSSFFQKWLNYLKEEVKPDIFTIGEYFSVYIKALTHYLDTTPEVDCLFDVPLHDHFKIASESGANYDISKIFQKTLVDKRANKAITFVDNHDTQPGQSLESWVQDWFKPLAYSMILLRKEGIPCVFYGDYYGIPNNQICDKKDLLNKMMLVRKYLIYGKQTNYFNDYHMIGWTLEGDYYHQDSGAAVILTNGDGGNKQMNVGKNLAGQILYDCTGNVKEHVYVDQDGNGIFYVNGGSVSIWIKKDNMYEL